MQVKKQQLETDIEPDMEQCIGHKLRKEYVKAVYCHLLINLYGEYIMQSAGLDEAQAGIKIVRRHINNLRYADATLLAENEEELKSLLMRVKEESKKLG